MAKQYITVVIELPEDPESKKTVMGAVRLFDDFHGGKVTALYAGDAISENEIYERSANPMLIKAVRDEVAARPA